MLIYLRFCQITFFFVCFDFLIITSIIDFFIYLLIILQDFVLFNRERIASFYSCIAKTTTMYMNTICIEFSPSSSSSLHGKNHSFLFCNIFASSLNSAQLNNQVCQIHSNITARFVPALPSRSLVLHRVAVKNRSPEARTRVHRRTSLWQLSKVNTFARDSPLSI